MPDTLFPFEVLADFQSGRSERSLLKAFLSGRPASMESWYGYDVKVTGPDAVTFTARDMRDLATGGLGDVVATFDAQVAPETLLPLIEHRALEMATDRRADQLAEAERTHVASVAANILAEALGSSPAPPPDPPPRVDVWRVLEAVKSAATDWASGWSQCGCTDAGCAGRHEERNAVLVDVDGSLIPALKSAVREALGSVRVSPPDAPV